MSQAPMSNPHASVSPEAAEYEAALLEGRLLLRVCQACGRSHHYPRRHCPFCLSDRTEWRAASGRGVIYSFTIVRRGPGAGSAPAFVTLEEGPTILTTIVGCDPDGIAIGQPVELDLPPGGGATSPAFTPTAR